VKDNPSVPDRFANCYGVINQRRCHVYPLAVVFLRLPKDQMIAVWIGWPWRRSLTLKVTVPSLVLRLPMTAIYALKCSVLSLIVVVDWTL
jgi:hypothetical protein